jgi:hypothetical protein
MSFSVVELEDRIFKFAVFDRRVGLHVYALKFFACDSFTVFFHLWNQSGLERARISRTLDQGPRYAWQPEKSPKRSSKANCSRSFADAVRDGIPASDSVFSRLDFSSIPDSDLGSNVHLCSSGHQQPHVMAGSKQRFSNVPLIGANAIPVFTRNSSNQRHSRAHCSRCFPNFHSRPNCRSSVRCSACFHFSHITETCRFPPCFPGLSSKRLFSSHVDSSKWKDVNYHTWFKSMTSGPNPQEALQPPLVTVAASSTSIPGILPEALFPARGNPTPLEQPPAFEVSPDLVLGVHPCPSHSPRTKTSSPDTQHRHCPTSEGSPADNMAFQFIDLAPFIPRGYNRVMIPGHRPMYRVILVRPSRRNLDLTIATVHPLVYTI